jgi:protein-tyrosine-phosphatase
MFKRYWNDSPFFKERLNSSSFSKYLLGSKRKGLFNQSNFDKSCLHLLFLSKRGTLRAPFAVAVLQQRLKGTRYEDKLVIFSRGVTTVYDKCPVDSRINSYAYLSGVTIEGQSIFASPKYMERADFIITLDEDSMEYAKLHRTRGYLYPFAFFRPSHSNEFVEDAYKDNHDNDSPYKDIISSIQFGCERIVLSLLPTLQF